MSKNTGPRLKLIRKFESLPALTKKTSNRQKTPGQHGKLAKQFFKQLSSYGQRLFEKQKLKFNYNITERQLINYIKKAKKSKQSTSKVLLILLEMRLDNIVYRLGMAPTIAAARQLVLHKHILVNKKIINIPSYSCQLKDVISVKTTKCSQKLVEQFVQEQDPTFFAPIDNKKESARETVSNKKKLSNFNQHKNVLVQVPNHLKFNKQTLVGVVNNYANLQSIELNVDPLAIIEYYGRK